MQLIGQVFMSEKETLVLRPVDGKDCRLLWKWANHPNVRKTAYDSDPIPWDDHLQWFHKKREDPRCTIYIAETREGPIGQIRFDLKGNEAVVDVSVDPDHHGRGYGTQITKKGTHKFLKESRAKRILAYIKVGNTPSIRSFSKSGYTHKRNVDVNGHQSHLFTCKRSLITHHNKS